MYIIQHESAPTNTLGRDLFHRDTKVRRHTGVLQTRWQELRAVERGQCMGREDRAQLAQKDKDRLDKGRRTTRPSSTETGVKATCTWPC